MYVGAFVNLRKPLFDAVNTWRCVMIRASCIIDEPSVKAVELTEGWFFCFCFCEESFFLTDPPGREGKEKLNWCAALFPNTISCQPGWNKQINITDCVYMDLLYPRIMIRIPFYLCINTSHSNFKNGDMSLSRFWVTQVLVPGGRK